MPEITWQKIPLRKILALTFPLINPSKIAMSVVRYVSALTVGLFWLVLPAQTADLANTPLNPIPVKYKAEHFNLKGPVFAAGKQVFEKNGLLRKELVQYSYDEKGLPTGKGSVTWERDADGRVIKEEYQNGRTTDFTYTGELLTGATYRYRYAKGAKIYDIQGQRTYSYDKQGRLIRETLDETNEENGDTKEVTIYAYTQDGDTLKVVKTVQKGGEPSVRHHETYQNGWLIHSSKEGDPIELTIEYTFDSYGNPVKFAHVQNNGVRDTFSRSFSYYPDLEKENRISFGSENRKTFYPIAAFRNGEPADDIAYTLTADKKTVLIYDEFSNTYYAAAFDPNRKPEDETPAQVFAAGTDVIALYNPDGAKVEPFYKGSRLFVNGKGKSLRTITGEILCFADSNLSTEATTILLEEPGNEPQAAGIAQVLRGKVLKRTHGRFDSHLFYAINEQGTFQLFNDGQTVGGKLKLESMSEGDTLLLDEKGEPKYVMLGGQTNPRPGIYEARYYVPSRDAERRKGNNFDGVPGFTATDIAALRQIDEKALRSRVQQKVDLVNAPLNQVAHANYREETGMKGDVAYVHADYMHLFFDEDGNRIYPRKDYFTSEAEARSHQGRYLRFDDGNKLVYSQEFTPGGWTYVYQYNPDGTLRSIHMMEGDQMMQVRDYTYDERGRVTKYVHRSGQVADTYTYAYTENDGRLTVVEKVTPVRQDKTSESVYVFENGREIERTDTFNGEVIKNTFKMEYDAQGNIARKTDQEGRDSQSLYYYEHELYGGAFPQWWHWKKRSKGDSFVDLYVDDRKVDTLHNFGKSPNAHAVFYEPITQRYLIARNAFVAEADDAAPAAGAMEIVSRGPFLLYLNKDKGLTFYRDGSMSAPFKQVFRTGDELLLYEPGKNRTYLVPEFQLGQERLFPVKDLGQDAVNWWQEDAKSNIVLIQNGEQIEGKGLGNGGGYPNGDRLLLKDGKPWMIITKAQIEAYDKVHLLTPYDGRGKPGEKPVAKKVETAPYNPKLKLAIRNYMGGHMYCQNGKPTYAPSASYKADSGNAFAYYPPGRYHFFEKLNAPDFKHDEVREQTRTAIENHLAEVDGQTVRVWYDGQRLRPEDYSVFDCSNRRKLLCIPSKKMYAQLAPENGFHEFRFLMPEGKLNFLIKNADGSLRVIERGKELTGEEVGLWISGKGHTIISVSGDPSYAIPRLSEELKPGIYGLDDFSYSYVNTD